MDSRRQTPMETFLYTRMIPLNRTKPISSMWILSLTRLRNWGFTSVCFPPGEINLTGNGAWDLKFLLRQMPAGMALSWESDTKMSRSSGSWEATATPKRINTLPSFTRWLKEFNRVMRGKTYDVPPERPEVFRH